MHMIGHQAVGPDPDVAATSLFRQDAQIDGLIAGLEEYRLPTVSALGHMMGCARNDDASCARHEHKL